MINPFKKSSRSSSPRYRFYVSREDLEEGEGSLEFEEDEEDGSDVASSRSFEDRSKDRMARAVSAEDLLDMDDDDARSVSRRSGFSKSMDELDAVGGFSLRSRSHDPSDPPGLHPREDQESSKEKNPRLQQQSVSEPGPKSVDRGRGVAKTLKKALPWIPRSLESCGSGGVCCPKRVFVGLY